ncbi:DNA polymerase III subunit epsilon [Aliikangiella coralliicola]|uniref:DNA polymerase III subunit epsilon n=1 Tax=Aliikangiella coralliicola TaxID=2592383 RepID=A0A545UAU1_9GAMM|nr:DNA polymerase III subunit epsilon [Aliikangiella coralliicola]TQV86586.1 DNA polymerase III subunit epsilon [Aliikangiella coralliicola]
MRQIVLDTETTGLEPTRGHRIIEIGCVEMVNRRLTGNHFHVYINPRREVDDGAMEVHGITNEFLADKPFFEDIAQDFINYVKDSELVIHNAPFDVGFLNHELKLLTSPLGQLEDYCTVLDTLVLARQMHPGQKNSLDALCKRYFIDNSHRDLHGALLDSEILAEVYLSMTGGQTDLTLTQKQDYLSANRDEDGIRRLPENRQQFKVLSATSSELEAHEAYLKKMQETCGDKLIWS